MKQAIRMKESPQSFFPRLDELKAAVDGIYERTGKLGARVNPLCVTARDLLSNAGEISTELGREAVRDAEETLSGNRSDGNCPFRPEDLVAIIAEAKSKISDVAELLTELDGLRREVSELGAAWDIPYLDGRLFSEAVIGVGSSLSAIQRDLVGCQSSILQTAATKIHPQWEYSADDLRVRFSCTRCRANKAVVERIEGSEAHLVCIEPSCRWKMRRDL
jgi:hypothetical protein